MDAVASLLFLFMLYRLRKRSPHPQPITVAQRTVYINEYIDIIIILLIINYIYYHHKLLYHSYLKIFSFILMYYFIVLISSEIRFDGYPNYLLKKSLYFDYLICS